VTPISAPLAPRKTVAVLPLLNLGVADDAYLAQTLTEDLVDLLSVVPELRVRPRGLTSRYDDKARDVREAGRELGVGVVVDGSVRRVAELVRVSVRLVTVEDGFQLWARRFDRAPGAVLTVTDDAAAAIARALATEVAEPRPAAVGDAVAQDLYLRGRYLMHRGWFEVSREGVALLRQAYERAPDDPRIAGAYSLAIARVLSTVDDAATETAQARALAERTLERHPSQPEALLALGFIHLNASEGAAAAVELRRALAISPNSVEALDAIGRLLVEIGRPELGIRTLQKGLAVDPSLAISSHTIARAHSLLGDVDAAREALGPVPVNPIDIVPYLLLRSRLALWRRDRAELDELHAIAQEATLSGVAKRSVLGLLEVGRTEALGPDLLEGLGTVLSLETRYPPRRLSFHAQMRAEVKLCARDVEGAIADLRVGDANGLLDLLWLDRCPLFDGHRERADFVAIRNATSLRADRVIAILDR
jgi:serine/threonine-protein kinase